MAKISLKEHLVIVEERIQERQIDEALAHCRHILRSYPKHVDTYRLLAKAYLEAKRYSDAGDIFQRVLSSTPDDFISHVGMSIIGEEDGDEDAAIWHMERAFEAQPSNRAVQDELRRLYNKREGFAPAKVRLTQGALARMYAHGDLYNQAISELSAALSENPNRPDLEVLLAEMYFKAQQTTEAFSLSSQLLERLPYCLYANLLIAEILISTQREEEAQAYLDRSKELDPYSTLDSSEEVDPNDVMLEAFEFDPSSLDTLDSDSTEASQPEGLEEEELPSVSEDLPDFLSSSLDEETEAGDESSTKTSEESYSEQEVPEWLRELLPDGELSEESDREGAQLSADVSDDPDLSPDEDTQDEEVQSKADDLGWLESLAAEQGAPEEELITEPEEREADTPKWLDADSAESKDKDSMAWLDELDSEEDTAPNEEIPKEENDQVTAADEFGTESPQAEEAPEWLKDLAEDAEHSTQPLGELQAEALERAPDWLDELQQGTAGEVEESSEADQEFSATEESPSLESVDFKEADDGPSEELDEPDLDGPEEESDWIPERTIEKVASLPPLKENEEMSAEKLGTTISVPDQSVGSVKIESARDGLELARQALNFDKLEDALGQYKKLLRKRDTLDEVIADLQAALSKYPKHVGLWQTLGDAYMRKDRLRDALESYTKAEDLL